MLPNPQFPADLVTFTEAILNGKSFFVQCDITIRLGNLLSFPLSNFSIKRMKSGGALIFLGIKFHIDYCIVYRLSFCMK